MSNWLNYFYYFLFGCSLISIWGIYYFEYIHFQNQTSNMEGLIGVFLVMVYTWPFWLGLPLITMIKVKHFGMKKMIASFTPLVAVALPNLIRSVQVGA